MKALRTILLIIISFGTAYILVNLSFSVFHFVVFGEFLNLNAIIINIIHPITIIMNIILILPSIIISVCISASKIQKKYVFNIFTFLVLTYLIPTITMCIVNNSNILNIENHQFLFSFLFVTPTIILLTKYIVVKDKR